jgi:hypothetical protein
MSSANSRSRTVCAAAQANDGLRPGSQYSAWNFAGVTARRLKFNVKAGDGVTAKIYIGL